MPHRPTPPNADTSPDEAAAAMEPDPRRTRPGGRSARVRLAVAQACLHLLAEGRTDLSPMDVSARSGVGRTTIYRWWPTPADLMREALALHTRHLEPPDTGSWAGDVRALVAMLAEFLADPIERAQNAILASGQHPELNEFLIDYFEPIAAAWQQPVRRAIERGEVPGDIDPEVVVRMLCSPLVVTTVIERRDPTDAELDAITRFVLRATSP